MFKGKHSEATKQKIAESRKKYTGESHPRAGAEWTDEQRLKYMLAMHQRREEEKQIKAFLLRYHALYQDFINDQQKK